MRIQRRGVASVGLAWLLLALFAASPPALPSGSSEAGAGFCQVDGEEPEVGAARVPRPACRLEPVAPLPAALGGTALPSRARALTARGPPIGLLASS